MERFLLEYLGGSSWKNHLAACRAGGMPGGPCVWAARPRQVYTLPVTLREGRVGLTGCKHSWCYSVLDYPQSFRATFSFPLTPLPRLILQVFQGGGRVSQLV